MKAALQLFMGRMHGADWKAFLTPWNRIGTRQAKGSLTAFNPDQLKSLSGSNFIGSATRLGASSGKWWKAVDDFWGNINKEKNIEYVSRYLHHPKVGSGPQAYRYHANWIAEGSLSRVQAPLQSENLSCNRERRVGKPGFP